MKFDVVVGNPPYDRNLHLKVINTVIKNLSPEGYGCFIHPARWLEDPLWEYKKSCDKKRFKDLVDKIESVSLIENDKIINIFDINYNGELMISKIKSKPLKKDISLFSHIANEAIKSILSYSIENNLEMFDDKLKRDGWRCQINDIIPMLSVVHDGFSEFSRKRQCNLFGKKKENVFFDGKTKDGRDWIETRNKNKHSKISGSPFPHSIRFDTEEEALNFEKSCNTNFYNNIMYLLKLDMNTPLAFLPYMHDYTHEWTDEDYCRFFAEYGMSEECQKWMCREVYDYRVKDFVEYTKIDK